MLNELRHKNFVIRALFCLVAPAVLSIPVQILFEPGQLFKTVFIWAFTLFFASRLFDLKALFHKKED